MITCLIPSQFDAVSLTEIKAHLRLDHSHEDDYIKTLIRAMTTLVEEYTNKSLLTQTWQLVHHRKKIEAGSEQIIDLPYGPLQAIVSVQHVLAGQKRKTLRRFSLKTEGQLTCMALNPDYEMVEITYRSGFGDAPHTIPAALRQAIVLGVGEMFEKRQNAFHSPNTLVHALMRPYCSTRLN